MRCPVNGAITSAIEPTPPLTTATSPTLATASTASAMYRPAVVRPKFRDSLRKLAPTRNRRA